MIRHDVTPEGWKEEGDKAHALSCARFIYAILPRGNYPAIISGDKVMKT